MKQFIFLLFLAFFQIGIVAQKYTFNKNSSIVKNLRTQKEVKSNKTDPITIERLGNGKFKLTDSNGSGILIYSHMEDGLYIYKIQNNNNITIRSQHDMIKFAKGIPGLFGMTFNDREEIYIYKLNN